MCRRRGGLQEQYIGRQRYGKAWETLEPLGRPPNLVNQSGGMGGLVAL
jgi:hypothetical protein